MQNVKENYVWMMPCFKSLFSSNYSCVYYMK